LIRIPVARGLDTRVELRSPDPACNPYLALAAVIEAGLAGVREKILPSPPVEQNLYLLTPEQRAQMRVKNLPANLGEALALFKGSTFIREVVGDHISRKLVELKEWEWEAYQKVVHNWEIKQYLARF